ncbi:hypothetical protein ACPPVT_18410 [Angustibacter sp. McL0619]|uniref:hypothetical protein n=1 Tax=Angustibacter sp. McL0619 TaxID=3415676 RepID=UPI003CF90A98
MHQPFAVYLVGAILLGGVLVAISRGLRRRRWVEGEALVTDVRFDRNAFDEGAPGNQLFVVRGEVLTPDGERHVGQAQDFYHDDAKAWQGQRRPAWYDPRRPSHFTLTPPLRERGLSGDDVFVYAVMALIAAVVLAVVLL